MRMIQTCRNGQSLCCFIIYTLLNKSKHLQFIDYKPISISVRQMLYKFLKESTLIMLEVKHFINKNIFTVLVNDVSVYTIQE